MDLHVEKRGAADTNRTLVWSHGLFGSVAGDDQGELYPWEPKGWRVVRYDARGHGRSSWLGDSATQTWDQLGLDMVAVADAVGADRFVAGGASMGCATALYAALAAPSRIEALILTIPPTAWKTRDSQASLYRDNADLLESRGLDAYLESVLRAPESPWARRELPDARRQRVARMRRMGGLVTVLRASSQSNLPPVEELSALAMPALVLAWEDDPVHPLATAERLTELLPAAELHVARCRADVLGWAPVVEAFLGRL